MNVDQKIRAIIIDDEPGCVSYLSYCLDKYCPQLIVLATGNSIDDFTSIVKKTEVDLAFLDISLQDTSIFEALNNISASQDFQIVFVTAFERYAVQAIKVHALDYLMKPLLDKEIIDCYKRILGHFKNKKESKEIVKEGSLLIRKGDEIFSLETTNIIYFKGKGAYTEVNYFSNQKERVALISKAIGDLEQQKEYCLFHRVHKSFFINEKYVQVLLKKNGYYIKMANDVLIPIAQRRVSKLLSVLANKTKGIQ